ncbi:MAG: LAGLIDADG family homing endonuclease [Parcubacteria group bacterium]|nr:LAGLIDADG family homing endonuclease [Parcubacteria group bacterium]
MNWDYIAGFVDGEGSITKKGNRIRILVSQTNKKVLDEIAKFSGTGFVYKVTKRESHWKDAWVYAVIGNKNVHKFLKSTKEKLIVKKKKAKSALRTLEDFFRKEKTRIGLKNYRIKTGKKLRIQGLTYRQIGKKLNTDFGYIRRLIKNIE